MLSKRKREGDREKEMHSVLNKNKMEAVDTLLDKISHELLRSMQAFFLIMMMFCNVHKKNVRTKTIAIKSQQQRTWNRGLLYTVYILGLSNKTLVGR